MSSQLKLVCALALVSAIAPCSALAQTAEATGRAVTAATTRQSLIAPERHANLFELSLFLAPAHLQEGRRATLFLDSTLTYRARAPVYARAYVGPLGVTFGSRTPLMTGRLLAGLDTHLFELGAGLGVARVTDAEAFPCMRDDGQACTSWDITGPVLMLTAETRIGARDGLAMTFAFAELVMPHRLEFGLMDATLQVPVARGAAVHMRFGMSNAAIGYVHTSLGLRGLVHGDGGRVSLYVTPAIGWTGASLTGSIDAIILKGLTGTLNVEYRP